MATRLSYGEQLKHPNWQRKRLEMLEAAGWECGNCGAKESTLHVHHRQYVKGRMAWEYEAGELAVLCEDCHEDEHRLGDELKQLLAVTDTTQALALLRGYYFNADWFDPWIGDMGRDRDMHTHALGMAARFLQGLRPAQLEMVVAYAVSLTSPDSEERGLYVTHSGRFQELP